VLGETGKQRYLIATQKRLRTRKTPDRKGEGKLVRDPEGREATGKARFAQLDSSQTGKRATKEKLSGERWECLSKGKREKKKNQEESESSMSQNGANAHAKAVGPRELGHKRRKRRNDERDTTKHSLSRIKTGIPKKPEKKTERRDAVNAR